jgi:hypothetical protein
MPKGSEVFYSMCRAMGKIVLPACINCVVQSCAHVKKRRQKAIKARTNVLVVSSNLVPETSSPFSQCGLDCKGEALSSLSCLPSLFLGHRKDLATGVRFNSLGLGLPLAI